MADAINPTMKLALAMNHSLGEDELHRRQEIRAQRKAEQRARRWALGRQIIDDAVRKLIRGLLVAAILLFLFTHFSQLHSAATKTTGRAVSRIQATAAASPLRQSTENYEKEVDSIAAP